jgi:hypothetical protein
MLARLCGDDPAHLLEADGAALVALAARERLWDAVAPAARAAR